MRLRFHQARSGRSRFRIRKVSSHRDAKLNAPSSSSSSSSSYRAPPLIVRQQHSAGRLVTALACTRRRRASCRPPTILISIIPPSITHIGGARRTISTATTPWVRRWGRPTITITIKRRVSSTCTTASHRHVSPNTVYGGMRNIGMTGSGEESCGTRTRR
jgi:hypothetical protein